MDINAAIEKAVEEKMEQVKGQIIKQTLEEDHDFIMFKLHKIFGETYKHLENYLIKEFGYADDKILDIVANMMDDVEETVTGKEVEKTCECDGTCTECACGKEAVDEEEVNEDRKSVTEVITDGEKRITIPYDAFVDAGLAGRTVKILKECDGVGTFYIVPCDFEFNENIYELVAQRAVFKTLRIGVGKLLNAVPGDYIGIDAYDGQLVVYDTDGNIEDDPTATDVEEDEVEKKKNELAERGAAALMKLLNALGFKAGNIEEIANKQGPNFKFKAYKIKI